MDEPWQVALHNAEVVALIVQGILSESDHPRAAEIGVGTGCCYPMGPFRPTVRAQAPFGFVELEIRAEDTDRLGEFAENVVSRMLEFARGTYP